MNNVHQSLSTLLAASTVFFNEIPVLDLLAAGVLLLQGWKIITDARIERCKRKDSDDSDHSDE